MNKDVPVDGDGGSGGGEALRVGGEMTELIKNNFTLNIQM